MVVKLDRGRLYCGAIVALFLLISMSTAQAMLFTSDDFSSSSLDASLWTTVDPRGDSTFQLNGTQLNISVPGGLNHDLWETDQNAARVLQDIGDTDFEIEIKFESSLSQRFQVQGLFIEQDNQNFLRFDFYYDGSALRVFAASFIAGIPTSQHEEIIANGSPLYLRVQRAGDQWTQFYSYDGANWNQGAAFSHPMLVARAGPFAGNAGGPAPAFTAVVDYAFNTASPIIFEDANDPLDFTPPVISNIVTQEGPTRARVSWSTDEPAIGLVDYGTTASFELGQVTTVSGGQQLDVLLDNLLPDTTYYFRISSEDANSNTRQSETLQFVTTADSAPGPLIDVWYGPNQRFGDLGTPQRWVNIVGKVTDPNGVKSLSYRVNGQPARQLSMGPDENRLHSLGDFNAEINVVGPNAELNVGLNSIEITAVDNLDYSTVEVVTVEFSNNTVWSLPYTVDWSSVTQPRDAVQIVDGLWEIQGSEIRPLELGYDRLIAIGDMSWTDYEITVPFTVHGLEPGYVYPGPSFSPGIGVLLRWSGHFDWNSAQPNTGWWSFGGFGWYRWRQPSAGGERFQIMGNDGSIIADRAESNFLFGVPHVLKMRVETPPNEGSIYSLKMWEQAQPEPAGWDLVSQELPTDPQSGSLLLVAHHVDATFGTVTIVPSGDTIGPRNSNIQVTSSETVATINWVTNEPAAVSLAYGVTSNYELGTVSDIALNASHSIELTGLSSGTVYQFQVTATDEAGNSSSSENRIFVTSGTIVPGPQSDDFDTATLDARWATVDPLNDNSVTLTGTQVALNVVGGPSHDVWAAGNDALRLMQNVVDQDFVAEVKFDSLPSQQYQIQGILVEQDNGNFLRFDYFSDGTDLRIFSASFVNGVPTVQVDDVVSLNAPMYLRVVRVSDTWTLLYSGDGVSWTAAGSYMHSLQMNTLGIFAGNAQAGNAPAYSALVDYFVTDVEAPVPDTTAPAISNIVVDSAGEEAILSWTTDEPAGSQVMYGTAPGVYELGTVSSATLTQNHSITLTGLTLGTVYYYQVSSSDADDNTGSSVDLNFLAEDLTAPTISGVQVVRVDASATISWVTNEPADSTLEYGETTAYELGTISSAAVGTSHSVVLNGLTPGVMYYFQLTATDSSNNSGSLSNQAFLMFGPLSDDFNTTTLDARWTTIDPLNDNSVALTGSQLELNVASGQPHDVWTSGNDALRLMQTVVDQDFVVEVKFDSLPTQRYQIQGVLVEQDNGNFLRFDYLSDGTDLRVFSASFINGVPTAQVNNIVSLGVPLYLRVERVSDTWTLSHSGDGVNWTVAGSYIHSLQVSTIGVFAGNTGGSASPAYTALVDSFVTNAVVPVPDMTPPEISNIVVDRAGGEATLNWTTDEPADSQIMYGTAPGTYELGTVSSAALVQNHSITLAGLTPGTVYYYQVSSSDADGNTRSSADLNFLAEDLMSPTIGSVQVTRADTSATISWITNEPTSSTLEYGETNAYELGSVSSGSTGTSHSVVLSGLTSDVMYYFQITATDGNNNSNNLSNQTFMMSGSQSDDFNTTTLDSRWTTIDPLADNSVALTGSQLELTIAGGQPHDVWTSGNDALRLMQTVVDQDFVAEVKFDSLPTQRYQIQGILVEQDNGNFLRFDYISDGTDLRIFSASFVDGVPTSRVYDVVSLGVPLYLRVERVGDTWTLSHSGDGVNWTVAVSYVHSLQVNAIGVFAGNTGGSGSPAYTALVDYFVTNATAFVLDTTSPVISNILVDGVGEEATLSWTTDELADSQVMYGTAPETYELGTVSSAALTQSHSITLAGLTPGTVYYYQVSSSDADGNTRSSADLNFLVEDLTAPMISDVQVVRTASGANISWVTNEPASSALEYGETNAYELGSASSGSTGTSHSVVLNGLTTDVVYYFQITATDGNNNSSNLANQTFLMSDSQSDDFNTTTLDARWTMVDPLGDSSVALTGSQLELNVPGGQSHDAWTTGNDTLRLMQNVVDQDFVAEVKFDSLPTQRYQIQGILVEQDNGNFLRFDYLSDGTSLRIFSASFAGGIPTSRVYNTVSLGAPLYLRVERLGDTWTLSHSGDGMNWTVAVSYVHSLQVNAIGVFAGNTWGASSPAYTALVDYFTTDAVAQ
ncbi:MAG: fibronectin type III domain-containing protein [Gammaproteobacteria bacterium]|nr:fibronectin type III domain-containing protein [Gammaproteobacteria bacterium]